MAPDTPTPDAVTPPPIDPSANKNLGNSLRSILSGVMTGVQNKGGFLSLIKKYGWIVLLLIIFVQFKFYNSLSDKHNATKDQLVLKEGELAKFQINGTNVRGAMRNPDGTVDHTNTYQPREGNTTISFIKDPEAEKKIKLMESQLKAVRASGQKDEKALKELEDALAKAREGLYKPRIHVRSLGLTFRPGFGILYAGDLYAEIDFKWTYWRRYSIKTGATTKFLTTGLTRHIDDFTPRWLHLENTEAQLVGGYNYAGGWRIGIGFRISG